MSTTKSPYEIRLEILQMAKDYMDKQRETAVDFAFKAFELQLKANTATIDQWEKFKPVTYTFEELMAKAAEMNTFITKK